MKEPGSTTITNIASKLKLFERFQKVDSETIKWPVTFDDPEFFVKPFTTSLTLKRGWVIASPLIPV